MILGGIHAAKTILAPIFMATFLAVLLLPPLRWLRSKGISQVTSLVIVILSVLIIGTTTTTIITTQLRQFARDLPSYRDRFNERLLNYNVDLGEIFPFLRESKSAPETAPQSKDPRKETLPTRPVRYERLLDERSGEEKTAGEKTRAAVAANNVSPKPHPAAGGGKSDDALPPPTEPVPIRTFFGDEEIDVEGNRAASPLDSGEAPHGVNSPNSGNDTASNENAPDHSAPETWSLAGQDAVKTGSSELFRFIGSFIGEMTVFASSAFIIMLLVIFMLLEASRLPLKITAALGSRNFTNERLQHVTEDIRRYMVIKTFVSLLVGLLVTALLLATGVQYPILWGIVAFFLNFIPNIGSVVAAIPPILLATVDQGMASGLVVTIFMMLINCGIGYILEPKLLGEGLDLSPLVVLLSLLTCGWILGPVGMFLSPPLAVIGKIILQSFPETRWIAVIMANTVPKRPKERADVSIKESTL